MLGLWDTMASSRRLMRAWFLIKDSIPFLRQLLSGTLKIAKLSYGQHHVEEEKKIGGNSLGYFDWSQ